MDVSKFLGKVIGIYLLIVSTSMILNLPQFVKYVNDLISNPSLTFVTGFFTLILGILMVVGHNVWEWNWRVLVTIVGWITLVKGASIIYYPQFINHLSLLFLQSTTGAYIAASLDLFLGLLLTYFGFRKKS